MQCQDYPLIKGDTARLLKFNGFRIEYLQKQNDYTINSISFSLKQRNFDHTFSLNILKYFFVSSTIVTLILYFRIIKHFSSDDLGLI